MTVLLYVWASVTIGLFIANFRDFLNGIADQAATAETKWHLEWDMWVAIIIHSIAEFIIYVLNSATRSIYLFLHLPSVVKEIKTEYQKYRLLARK